MKQGKENIGALAREVHRQEGAKEDVCAPTAIMEMQLHELIPESHRPDPNDLLGSILSETEKRTEQKQAEEVRPIVIPRLILHDKGRDYAYDLTDRFATSSAVPRNIPTNFALLLKDAHPDLYVATWNRFNTQYESNRMIRSFNWSGNGGVREARFEASNMFNTHLDNFQVMEQILPILLELKCTIVSCDVTPDHLYIKALSPKLTGDIRKGDVIRGGIVLRNSETGMGSFELTQLIERLVCLNGLILPSTAGGIRRRHVGSRQTGGNGGVFNVLRDETIQKQLDAFWSEAQDLTRNMLDENIFRKSVKKLQETTERKLEGDIPEGVRILGKKMQLTEKESSGVMRHLIEGGDLSQWGVVNAVTRLSQDVESYERATELEAIGGKIVEMNRRDWKDISEAEPKKKSA